MEFYFQPSPIPGRYRPYHFSHSSSKKLMKIISILMLFAIIGLKTFAQDSLWKINSLNDVLSFSLPASAQSRQSGYIKAFTGELNSNYYGFQYYDTIISPIEDSEIFRIALLGFISGRASDSTLKGYSALVTDTSIGGSSGLMGKFTTNETLQFYKQIYYYATIANDRYCWFYAYSPSNKENNEEVRYFFNSIKFVSEKLKEKKFKLAPVYLKKDRL